MHSTRPIPIVVDLPGEPIGKGRPRVRVVVPKRGDPFPHFYPEPETERYEKAFAQLAKIQMRSKPPLEGPLVVTVTAARRVPESWSNKKRDASLAGVIRPTSKPDGDNYLKIACDACNKIVWKDDAQIVDKRVVKIYSEKPSLRLEVKQLEAFAEIEDESDC